MENIEKRFGSTQFEFSDRIVSGYALLFDTPSDALGWEEVICRGAITEETIKNSDIFATFNHNEEKVLARSKYGEGSLILDIDDVGLKYTFEAPQTALGDELLEYLKRGDIQNSSFAFSVPQKEFDKWEKRNGKIHRDILKIDKLYDVSPVFQPAYSATTCYSQRGKEVLDNNEEIERLLDAELKEIEDLI